MWCTLHDFALFIINGFHCDRNIPSVRFHDLDGLSYRKLVSLCQSCQTSLIDLFCKSKICVFSYIRVAVIDLGILIRLSVEKSGGKLTVGTV